MSGPRVSVITAVYDPPRELFEETVAAVLAQTSTEWEWVLADDRSPSTWVVPRLRELAASDPRIHVEERAENGGIAAASNTALGKARGEFVALLDHDDILEHRAIASMLAAVDGAEAPDEVDYVYSDQDLMRPDGTKHRPFRKPDWSPERFRHHMYSTHFSMLRRSLVNKVGGFRSGYDGSQDHDLVLRVTEEAKGVVHVPDVLYHWREAPNSAAGNPGAKPYAWDAGVRAVQDHLDRVGIDAVAGKGPVPGHYVVHRTPDLETTVSIIIPTIGSSGLAWGKRRTYVVDAVRSVLARSSHPELEFVIVYDSPTPPEVLQELASIDGARLRLVEFTEPFNFAAKCNVGATHATGDVLLFLNDDIEAISEGCIETAIAPLREQDVGATGALLLFEDTRIQFAGTVYGSGRLRHSYRGSTVGSLGFHGELVMNREVSALTAAFLAVRAPVFWEAGGFSETFPGNYNDVDFSLKLRHLGYRLLWMSQVVLYHFTSATRDPSVQPGELEQIHRRWGDRHIVKERFQLGPGRRAG